jgi:hypothetical protein
MGWGVYEQKLKLSLSMGYARAELTNNSTSCQSRRVGIKITIPKSNIPHTTQITTPRQAHIYCRQAYICIEGKGTFIKIKNPLIEVSSITPTDMRFFRVERPS